MFTCVCLCVNSCIVEARDQSLVLLLSTVYIVIFEIGSVTGLELTKEAGWLGSFRDLSACLHLTRVVITSVCRHAQLFWVSFELRPSCQ